MVNLSDIAAMGGEAVAIVDVLGTANAQQAEEIWAGLRAASQAYGVPIVGGHTSHTRGGACFLTAAVLGKAAGPLLTSFDAQSGDELLMAVDLRGAWRSDKPFWNASTGAPPQRLRSDLRLLQTIAEEGWSRTAKDISNGGVVGTLAMLLECSGIGAELWLDRLPRPPGTDLKRWLVAFPSYGYLLTARPEESTHVLRLFAESGISCERVGRITSVPSLRLGYGAALAAMPWFAASSPDTTFL
jgi:selenophosphate synthetase-related protein